MYHDMMIRISIYHCISSAYMFMCVFLCMHYCVYALLCVSVFVIYLSMEKLYFVVKYFDFCGLSTPTKVL